MFSTGESTHPAEAVVPNIGAVRLYLWTVTHVESQDRPEDEFKVQLIVPGQARSRQGRLTLSHRATFLLGYSPDYGVFVGWEARLHPRFGFSTTVQVKEGTLDEARSTGWAVAEPRMLRVVGEHEVRVAFAAANLCSYLRLSIRADRDGRSGTAREAFFLSRTPNQPRVDVPETDIAAFSAQLRRERLIRVMTRDARFGPRVKREYGFACAVCRTQLEIVEGAHIMPVSVRGSTDEIWNGIALCPNHHKLFDSHVFTVARDLRVHVDADAVDYLRDEGRASGVDVALSAFDRHPLQEPLFFGQDDRSREKMLAALEWRARLAGGAGRQ